MSGKTGWVPPEGRSELLSWRYFLRSQALGTGLQLEMSIFVQIFAKLESFLARFFVVERNDGPFSWKFGQFYGDTAIWFHLVEGF